MNRNKFLKYKNSQKKLWDKASASHVWNFMLIAIALCALIITVILYIILNITKPEYADVVTILLYVVPSCAVGLLTAAIFLYRRNQKKLSALIEGFNCIAEGDFSYRIETNSQDDYNKLYSNFNKMVEELNSVQSLRESFVHDFSHEFKTPIASINGFANYLLDGDLSKDEEKKYLKIIADESHRLSHLAENTLLLSKLDNLNFVGEKKSYRLDVQIKDCVISLADNWSKKNLSLSSDMSEITFTGNDELMRQVWINLILNAVKFTPQDGEICTTLYEKDGKIYATVKDSGIGMTEEVKARIFDKYYQGDKSRSVQGNGLGLSIVKRIVDLHEGEIKVESEEGKGSAFTVILPVEEQEYKN